MIYNISSKKLDRLPVTARQIHDEIKVDPVLGRVLIFVKSGWPDGELDNERLSPLASKSTELKTEQDCILWGMRVVIPNELREAVIAELHMAHHGVVRPHEDMSGGRISTIELTVRQCAPCQANVPQPSVAPLTPWMWPGKSWYRPFAIL